MSFKNIKAKIDSQQGFTIVELLIVIVVIGILAAITIVSYNGITARANLNSAKSNASTFASKAEVYLADGSTGKYPLLAADVQTASDSGKSFYIASTALTISYSTTALTSASPVTTIRVLKCGSGSPANQAAVTSSNITGLKIIYFDYVAGTETTSPFTVGDSTTCPTT